MTLYEEFHHEGELSPDEDRERLTVEVDGLLSIWYDGKWHSFQIICREKTIAEKDREKREPRTDREFVEHKTKTPTRMVSRRSQYKLYVEKGHECSDGRRSIEKKAGIMQWWSV